MRCKTQENNNKKITLRKVIGSLLAEVSHDEAKMRYEIPLAPFTRSPPSQLLEILDVVKIIQLFRKRLSEKVHATKSARGFVCPVLQRNFKEWHESPRTYVRKC